MYEFNIGPLGNWNGSVRVITKLGNIANETVDVICVSVSDSLRHSHSVWNALTKVAGTKEYKVAFDKARESVTNWLTPGDVLAVDATTTKFGSSTICLELFVCFAAGSKIRVPRDSPGHSSSCAVTACTAIYETAISNAFSCIQMVEFVDIKQDVVNKFAAQLHAKFVNSDTMESMEATNIMQKFIKPLSEVVEDDCSICLSALGGGESEVFELPCAHQYHVQCFKEYLNSPGHKKWCPICRKYFELPLGDQPSEARMFINKNFSLKLPGHEDSDFTYEILYIVENGIQEASHIRPGKPFSGTHRRAYVPGTPEGTEVLRLLKFAFERRLIFTVGDSVTTGARNVVVWNSIHHKTSVYGGPQKYGYPDPDYLNRVKEEISAMGITVDMLPSEIDDQ
uniref:E3 ubiquitin-protein ligase n=1 Tax=Angiostrongylus cantonensis TaxID=6313 RepID=A0A158PA62_ANGCA